MFVILLGAFINVIDQLATAKWKKYDESAQGARASGHNKYRPNQEEYEDVKRWRYSSRFT